MHKVITLWGEAIASGSLSEPIKNLNDNYLFNIVLFTGAIMLLVGCGELIMSYSNDRPDAKTHAIIKIAVGAFMLTIKTLSTTLLNLFE